MQHVPIHDAVLSHGQAKSSCARDGPPWAPGSLHGLEKGTELCSQRGTQEPPKPPLRRDGERPILCPVRQVRKELGTVEGAVGRVARPLARGIEPSRS